MSKRFSVHLNLETILSTLWTIALLSYILRSIFEPIKYIFYFSFIIIAIIYPYYLKNGNKKTIFSSYIYTIKEFLILGLILTISSLFSTELEIIPIKDIINFSIITFLGLIYYSLHNVIDLKHFSVLWIKITFIVGLLGLLNLLSHIIDYKFLLFNFSFSDGTSLVRDQNFYANHFIFSIIIYFSLLYTKGIKYNLVTSQLILTLFLLNVLFSHSRRAFIIITILFVISVFILILKDKRNQNRFYLNLLLQNILISIILISLFIVIPNRQKIFTHEKTRNKITNQIYRYSTILFPKSSKINFEERLWYDKSIYDNKTTKNSEPSLRRNKKINLVENGSFENGLEFWTSKTTDSISLKIINTSWGGKAVRVQRYEGSGFWPLAYIGRDIFYHKGVKYTFRFKFKVIEGVGVPFKIGWWVKDNGTYRNNLFKNIRALNNGWQECNVSYKFKNDHFYSPSTFMNSLEKKSIVDFTDIELIMDDTLNYPTFSDEVVQTDSINLLYNGDFKYGHSFWLKKAPDTITHKLIETEFGKAIRVHRNEGNGYWPLTYIGRHIAYYKNITYTYNFKFRVVKGNGIPFKIGWWINDGSSYKNNLSKKITRISDEWYSCTCSHKFQSDYFSYTNAFMNSQDSGTIIDFADIRLTSNDSLNRPKYLDQLSPFKIKMSNQEKDIFTSLRTVRWHFSFELFEKYTLINKIFGKGTDYGNKFAQKFFKNEMDFEYPHNPILSAFLYSGIVGGIFYIYFLSLSLFYYWKHRRQAKLLFILYLTGSFFVFFSGNSHFSVPIYALLSIVPFFINHFNKNKIHPE